VVSRNDAEYDAKSEYDKTKNWDTSVIIINQWQSLGRE
jgi:hypothetical protein